VKYLVLLLLAGCSYMTVDEQEDELYACDNAGGDCEVLREELERRIKREIARRQQNVCPKGLVELKDGNEIYCITQAQLNDMFRKY
jgi:hypothetical protein